jgi:DNA-binding NarL/FixJ family response regulator
MDIAAILSSKFSNAEWTLNGDDYEGLVWLSETPKKPTKAKLTELWPSVEAAQQAQAEAKAAARESALAKLAALGLTEAEIAAL